MRQTTNADEPNIDLLDERFTSSEPSLAPPIANLSSQFGDATPIAGGASDASSIFAHDSHVELAFIAPATAPLAHDGLNNQDDGGFTFAASSSEASHGDNGTQWYADRFGSTNSTNFGPASDLVHFEPTPDLIHSHEAHSNQTNISDSGSAPAAAANSVTDGADNVPTINDAAPLAASSSPIIETTSAAVATPQSDAPVLAWSGDLGSTIGSDADNTLGLTLGNSGGTNSGTTGTIVQSNGANAGLTIDVVYDSSVANAPAGFTAAVNAVVDYYESHFTNPVTVTIDVGYGEVGGMALESGALGESETALTSVSYSQLETALANNANAIGDTAAAASLSATSPVSGATYYIPTAEAEALGLSGASASVNGYAGFSSTLSFAYNDTNGSGVGSNQYDFFGTVAHEFSEIMGRQMLDGDGSKLYEPLDLFHYSASGVRDFSGTTAGYASINGGVTDLNNFNTNTSGDFGDWASTAGADSYLAFSGHGAEPVTAADLSLMNALGWQPASSTTSPLTVISVVDSPASGDLDAGKTVTLALNMSEVVTVAGGTPTLTLNDGGTATYDAAHSTSTSLVFDYAVAAGQTTAGLAATAVNLNSATVIDGAGNAANLSLSGLVQNGPQIDTTAPTVSSVAASGSGITNGSGDLNAGHTVTLTLDTSEAVTVANGTPTLTLNDGGTATYSGGSGTNALTFTYTVAAGQNTPDLAVTAVNLGTATVTDAAGNAANLAAAVTNPAGTVQIDTTTPTVTSIAGSFSGNDLDAGKSGTVTLTTSEAVTVAGGAPSLTLNDGGTATYDAAHSTSTSLVFDYTVAAGQNTASLAATAVNLNSAIVSDGAGNAANLSLSGLAQSGPQIDTITPTVTSVVNSFSSGDLNAGKSGTVTLTTSEAVTITGGTPTLTLNDGGTATYDAAHSTSTSLVFDYTAAAGQNTASLAATAVNLNSAIVSDGAGNGANLSLSGLTQNGPQIDTMSPTVASVVNSFSSGDLNAGKSGTVTLTTSEAVTVTGGAPTLTLNDGGSATYDAAHSTATSLVFDYTVAAGQNTASLAATAVNLNSAIVSDSAGNAANLSLSGLAQNGPQIDTTAPTAPVIANDVSDGNNTVTLSGTAEANSTVTVYDGQAVLGTTTASAGGNWSYATGALANGVQTFTASATDAAGNTGAISNAVDPFVGQLASPSIVATSPDGGTIGGITNATSLTLSGSAVADSAVAVFDGSTELATVTANASGVWSYTTGTLANGSHSFTATDSVAGTVSTASAPVTVTVDTVAPSLTESLVVDTGISSTDQITSNPTLSGNGNANAVVTLTEGTTVLGTTIANANGVWTFTPTGLAQGSHTIVASETDAAGNIGTASLTFTLDSTAPTVSSASISGNGINNGSGTLTAGETAVLTLALSGAVTVAGGVPSLALSNGATAVYDAAHSTATSLAFDYTVQGGQSSSSLAVTGVNLNSATVTDVAGNAANFAGATSTFPSLTVNASPTSVTTLNANGTIHDIHYYGIAGQAYTDYDVVYGTNNKPAEALYSNGMTDTYTYNSNGTLHEDYQGITGQKYTSTDTVYGANNTPASEVWSNGSTVVQTETWNANGTINDIHYYGVTGQAYTDYDVVYGANNKAASATFSNGMTETLTYNSANTLQEVIYQGITAQKYTSTDTVYGANNTPASEVWSNGTTVVQTETWNANGTINDVHYYGITGQPYTDYDVVYGANSKAASATFSNGMTETLTYNSANTLQEVIYQGITGQKYTSTDTVYGANNTPASEVWSNGSTVVQTETWNANGTINDIHYYGVTGQAYTDYDVVYGANNKAASATFSNGMTETLTYNSANTLQEVIYQGITGQKYTSTDTGYGVNNTPASEVWSNGTTVVQTETWNANGTIADVHYYGITGQAYTDYDVVYGANNKPAEAIYSNGMTDTYTYNSDGSLHEQDYQGVAGQKYTSMDTVYGANNTPASEVWSNGSTVVQTETWNTNGTVNDVHYYGITGQAYTDYDVVYGANNKPAEAIYSNGMTDTYTYNSDGSLHEQDYQGVAGQKYTSMDTVYGANNTPASEVWSNGSTVVQTETWNANGTIADVHYYGITGQAYTDYDVIYAANNKPAEAIYSNGMTDTYTYNSDGSLHEQDYQGVAGQKYTSMDTVYGANNTPASEVWANGSTVVQTETWNTNGTVNDVHYYGITGQAYTDYDVVYGANNKPAEAIYSNGMTDTYTYNSDGSLHEQDYQGVAGQKYTSMDTVYGANNTPASEVWANGSTVVQTETWNTNGTVNDVHYYGITGQAYTDEDVLYGANNKPAEALYSNGMTDTFTYNSDGTLHEQVYEGITGQKYAETDTTYGANNTPASEVWSDNNGNTTQTETWNANGTVLVTTPGEAYVTGTEGSTITGGNSSNVLDGSAGNVNITAGNAGAQMLIGGPGDVLTGGNTADTFIFPTNLGNETINNFHSNDVIELPVSEVANFAALQADMHTSGADTVITLDAHDAITVSQVAVQNLVAQNFHFMV